eukprot:18796-Heterococcus_DN1.PRE.5
MDAQELHSRAFAATFCEAVICLTVYEKNIHETLQSFLKLREERAADYDRTFTLISKNDHARERRRKVFDYFSEKINQANCFQTEEVFKVSEEILSILEENREQLELLMNWCDLCLPANETAFAEAHRLKHQLVFQRSCDASVTLPMVTRQRVHAVKWAAVYAH